MKNTLLTSLILLLGTAASAAAGTVFSFINVSSVNTGDNFTVDVVANTTSLFAFNFDVTFDPTLLNATSVTGLGDFVDNAGYLGIDNSTDPSDSSGGTISFVYSIATSGNASSGAAIPLAEINFTAISAGVSALNLANFVVAQYSGDLAGDPNVSVTPGSVTITDKTVPAAAPEPAPAALLATATLLIWGRHRKAGRQ